MAQGVVRHVATKKYLGADQLYGRITDREAAWKGGNRAKGEGGELAEGNRLDLSQHDDPTSNRCLLWKIDPPFIRHLYGGLVLNIDGWEYKEGKEVSL